MKGFFGKILKVDLKARRAREETMPDEVYETGLGGKGLASYLLTRDNPPGVDPLSPANRLIFALGPVSDTRIWGSCRHGVFTKSPLTGLFSESYAGGKAAEPMSRTGYDAFILENASAGPVWLEISDKLVSFHDAKGLQGADTYSTEDTVLERAGVRNAGAVVIGPAGENKVRFAVIENDYWRSLGRTGVGAVMGSKNLKAVVFHGEQKRPVASKADIEQFAKATLEKGKDNPGVLGYRRVGTPMLVAMNASVEGLPSKYWHQGTFDDWSKISGESLLDRCDVKATYCKRCFIGCGNLSEVKEGRHKGLRIEGPEYETIFAFGGLCMIHDLNEIIYLNDICDRLGLDTMSAGSLCAFAMEASETGHIPEKISWGDAGAVAQLLTDTANRKGLGAILAQGIRYAAKVWDMEDVAIHVKGLDPAGYDPRVLKGMGLAFATADRGACHLRSTFYKAELAGMIAPEQMEGKARLFLEFEDRFNIHDSLILCRFYRDLYWDWGLLAGIVRMTTGMDLDEAGLRSIASHIKDVVRRFNIREGMRPEDDTLPRRFFEEPLGKDKKVLKREDFRKMLSDYYALRGWSPDGVPPAK
jgi:aldehyde:ferredoxin oxidoreductase